MPGDTAILGELLEEDGEHGGEERRLARLLIGGRMLRRRRLRRLLLAHLLRSRAGERVKTRTTTRTKVVRSTGSLVCW